MNKFNWIDGGSFRVFAKTDKGKYILSYEDGLWGYIFPDSNEFRGFDTFGDAKRKCEEHYESEQRNS